MTTLRAFSRHYLTALAVRSAPLDHLIKRVKLSSEFPRWNKFSSKSRCEKQSVCPHSTSVLQNVAERRKLSLGRLAHRAESGMVTGLSKINSLILLTAFVVKILLFFYEMQVLQSMSIV